METIQIPPNLARIAGNRDFITTNEFAEAWNVKPQTVRRNYCVKNECYGVTPIKKGWKLLWSVSRTAEALGGNL